MKKLLALVLALVMSMSLVTISNAAFSDADKISHDEAVDVLNTLGVINGMPDGSFAPDGNVTRAEMAKMISIIMLGDVDASAFVGTATGLTDIKGHWAEGYIQYCYSQGIIAGRGDGTFAPNANVTAVEAAKMLLGAIGYNATVQGYVGQDWAINVTRDAQVSGFYDQLKGLSSNKALSRDEAAQMIYNAVVADLIEKTPSLNINTGSIEYTYSPNPNKSLMGETFGAVKVVGVVTANEFTNNTGLKGKTTVDVTNHGANEEQNVLNDGDYKVATTPDMIGMSVTMYVKPWGTNSSNVTKATVLGTPYVNDNNQVYTTTSALVDDATKSNDVTKALKNAGLQIQAADLYTNYVDSGANLANAAGYAGATGDGIVVDFIDNDADGKVDIVRKLVKSFGKVATASTAGDGKLAVASLGSANVALNTTEANEDVADFASLNLAKNDYVSYYKVSDTYYVEKVEGTTVTVTSTKGADALCKVNGTYTKSALANATDMSAAAGAQDYLDAAVTVGKSAVLYLDAYGYVVYVDAVADSGNYLMVTGIDTYSEFDGSLKMKVVKEDGTTDTVKIASLKDDATTWKVGTLYVKADINTATAAASDQTRGDADYDHATNVYGGEYFANGGKLLTTQVYSYSVNDKGEYALTVPSGADNEASTTITKGNASSVANQICNAATIFVVKTGSSWTTYTGIGNVPTLTSQTVYFVDKEDAAGTIKILFVTSNLAAVNNNVVVFASNAPTITEDSKGNTVYTYDVIYKNAITTLTADATSNTTISGADAGLYYGVVATDGKITTTGTRVAKSEVTAFDGQYISTASAAGNTGSLKTYGVDDATKVFVVTSGEAAEGTVADITVKDAAVIPNIAGSNVVIVARDTTGADQYMADTIVIYK